MSGRGARRRDPDGDGMQWGARRRDPDGDRSQRGERRRQSLGARVEILKLAHLLGIPPERLEYLEQVSPKDIRALREQVTDMLFTAQDATLRRLAAASRLLPVGLVALIAERAFGPMLSARIAGLLDPGRAVEISSRLPTPFLADVAIELDPRRAKDVLARIPADRVATVTTELVSRQEWVTMGQFVGHLNVQALKAAVDALSDEDLLRAAFVMEDKERLDELAETLGEQRLKGLIDAANSSGLWPEALDLVSNLNVRRREELVALAGERGEEVLRPLIEAAEEHGLWDELSMLAEVLNGDAQVRLRAELSDLLERLGGDAQQHLRQRLGEERVD